MNKEDFKGDFTLLNIGYAYHNADWNWQNIQSPFARIHYIKNGTAKIIREDGIMELKKDHLYLTPSYVKHGYQCSDILELYYIHLYEVPGKKISVFDLVDFPVEILATPLDMQLIERLIMINPDSELKYYDPNAYDNSVNIAYNVAFHQKSALAVELETDGIIKQLFSRFLALAVYKNEHIEERILKSLHYIHTNIDTQIDLEHLAEICFLTKDHFIRLFKREMDCTPVKYINKKKIEIAQLRILIDNTNIKEIAYGLGFDNISYFNRLFKKITGQSPGMYKKGLRI